jgi:hypothetical protein
MKHCPSVGGCPFAPDAATVYADRAGGGRLFVDVFIDEEGLLRAVRPQPVEEVP